MPYSEYKGKQYYTKDGESFEVLGWCSHCTPHYRPDLSRGNCHVSGKDMSYLWFGKFWGNNPSPEAERAMEICSTCPIKVACRQYADDQRIEVGIWGGEPAHVRKERWNATANS